jgi:hypothetical protein
MGIPRSLIIKSLATDIERIMDCIAEENATAKAGSYTKIYAQIALDHCDMAREQLLRLYRRLVKMKKDDE